MIDRELMAKIIEIAIVEYDIRVHPSEIDRARAVFAADRGLTTEQEIEDWLRAERLTRAELADQLRRIIAFGKLKDLVVGDRAERASGGDRRVKADLHRRIFEEWLEEQQHRL